MRSCNAVFLAVATVGIFGISARCTFAATDSFRWTGGEGDWNTSGSWLIKVTDATTHWDPTSYVPGDYNSPNQMAATIANGSTVTIGAQAGATGIIAGLSVGSGATSNDDGSAAIGSLTLHSGASITATSAIATNYTVGCGGTGSVTQDGGSYDNPNGNFYLGGNSNTNLTGGTGTYSQSGGTVKAKVIAIGSASGTGTYNLSGGTLQAYTVGNGGQLQIGVYNGANGAGTGTFNISGSGVLQLQSSLSLADGSGSTSQSGTLSMTGGQINIEGGSGRTITIGNYGTGIFTQSAGTVCQSTSTAVMNVGYNASSTGTYTLSGTGTANLTTLTLGYNGSGTANINGGTMNIGAGGINVGSSSATTTGIGTLSITGGTLNANTAASTLKIGVVTSGTVSISGGNVNLNAVQLGATGKTGGTLRVIGSAATIDFASTYTAYAGNNLQVYLDESGLSTLTGVGNVTLAGTLKAGFKGGAALLRSSSATVITTSGSLSGSFAVTPDPSMWTTTTTTGSGGSCAISLASGAQKAGLDASATADSSFAAAEFGYLAIGNINTSTPLDVYLDVDPGTGKTLADLKSFFESSGLSATLVSTSDYDVKLHFAAPSAATERFAWDLSDFNSTATVSGIGVIIPEPTAISFLAMAATLGLRRRRA